ncbi:DUF47 family protein [Georgenia sp. TF02-10]|uniref:DUF47 domain-containing protein n=1 Tax=Georgenia sp. TF02-10 TaxID=2917725 RepID=UPI001FA7AFBB|nr:DUF47 family protein [Georgenia sp. TF02-10]UNX54525.1 DUF47 family protein [Georgenia sp. TF02-10]
MRFRPTPRDASFFSLLSTTAGHLVTGAGLLAEILGADRVRRAELASRLHDVEHAADESTHQVMRRLNQTFVTPFDRDDIYQLASTLDDCMDDMDEAGDLIVLYKIGDLPAGVSEQVAVLQRCAELTADAVPRLSSLDGLREYWVEINRLENQADQVYRRLLAELFDNGTDPMTVIKLKGVIDALESAADAFERLANGIETIALKES